MQSSEIQSVDNLIETNALIEQHIHGGFGIDFAVCDTEDFLEFSKKIIKYGVCGFFPTLATDSVENLKRQILRIKEAIELQKEETEPFAYIFGVHLEACFLNPEKKGIHDVTQLLSPTVENYKLLEDDIIKIVTLAPELDKNYELCEYLQSSGVRVSAGHCKASDLSKVQQVTHLYNAMGAFSHRGESTVVSALSDDKIFTELIADGFHVDDSVLKITFRTKPLDKIILISDALPLAHADTDSIKFCNKTIYMKENRAVDSTGTMAGSTSFVSDIIKRLVKTELLDLNTAASMASTNLAYLNIKDRESKIYWDKDLNISAMYISNELITF